MNNTERQLLELIKESLFGNGSISFSNFDYDAVMKEASIQAVQGIVVSVTPKEYASANLKNRNISDKQFAKYIRYLHEEDELKNLLDEKDIPFVILKGNAAAMYYKNPSCRSMGDVDFLVREEDFSHAKNVLLNSAFCGAQRTPMRFRADAMRNITDAPKLSFFNQLFSF